MAMSVNTNVGAMAALQSLKETNRGLATVQTRINTGQSVSSTKDDSAAYTIAQTLRGDLGGLKAVGSSLARAKSTVDVAVAGAEQVSDLVNKMKAKAAEASDTGVDTASRSAINEDFKALRDQVKTIIDSSEFNGTNLLKDGTVAALQSVGDDMAASGSTLNVSGIDLEADVFDAIGSGGINSASGAADMIDTLDDVSEDLNTHLSTLGAASRKIESQSTFVGKLSDVIEAGIGNLVDADLAKESAKLQALQVKQQLGIQALSIANQAPQSIMSLFR